MATATLEKVEEKLKVDSRTPRNCPECHEWHFGNKNVCHKCLSNCSRIERARFGVKMDIWSF